MAAVSVKGLNYHFFTEGVSSTPTFFLNGMFLAGDVSTKWTEAQWKGIINKLL